LIDADQSTSKEALVAELELVPGVIIVDCFYGRLAVTLEYDDEMSVPRQVELVRRLSGARDVFVARWPFPECKAALSARDWDLIRALRRSPRKTYSALAREIGVSSRTVKRKLSRMTREGVAFAWPSLNLRMVRGNVIAWLFVLYASERKSEIDDVITRHIDDYVWHISHLLPYHAGGLQPSGFNLAVPNVAITREIESWARAVPGIETARVELHELSLTHFESYDERLDRKLRQLPTATPAVTVNTHRKRLAAVRHL
jgi:hypothetical protein